MTITEYKALQPFEVQMRNAAKSHYVRFSRGELGKLRDVYEALTGDKMGSRINCSACVLKMISRLYEDYTKYHDWYLKRFGKEPEE